VLLSSPRFSFRCLFCSASNSSQLFRIGLIAKCESLVSLLAKCELLVFLFAPLAKPEYCGRLSPYHTSTAPARPESESGADNLAEVPCNPDTHPDRYRDLGPPPIVFATCYDNASGSLQDAREIIGRASDQVALLRRANCGKGCWQSLWPPVFENEHPTIAGSGKRGDAPNLWQRWWIIHLATCEMCKQRTVFPSPLQASIPK